MKQINECRICKNKNLKKIVNLGNLSFTGIFPKKINQKISKGRLELLKCHGHKEKVCGLVQLSYNFNLNQMYGKNYGYRSSLNNSMIVHLKKIISNIKNEISLKENDLIIDIGSNDGTTLSFYDNYKFKLVGIDPTAKYFKKYYKKNIKIISDFFSKKIINKYNYKKKAKLITSFAMFYDLKKPLDFAKIISETLNEEEGLWVFEQSYLPTMLKNASYDTICHEHIEYYALKQIQWICNNTNLKIIDIEKTNANGGSILIKCSHKNSKYKPNNRKINNMLKSEKVLGLDNLNIYKKFVLNIEESKNKLIKLIRNIKNKGKKVFAIGASTKGNVILQYCNLDKTFIDSVGEINKDKFGSFTPGTKIPILDEKKILSNNFDDYFLILPWHFKYFFLNSKIYKNKNIIFPLPKVKIYKTKSN